MRSILIAIALGAIIQTAGAQTTPPRPIAPSVSQALDRATGHRQAGRLAQAEQEIDQALAVPGAKATSDTARLYRLKADLCLQRLDFAGADREIERGFAVWPDAAFLRALRVYADVRARRRYVDGYCALVRQPAGKANVIGRINRSIRVGDLSTTDIVRMRQAIADGALATDNATLSEDLLILDTKLSILAANREATKP